MVFFFFSNPERAYSHIPIKSRIKEVDLVGALFLICAIVSLLLALQWGGNEKPWSSKDVIATLVLAGVLLILFAI